MSVISRYFYPKRALSIPTKIKLSWLYCLLLVIPLVIAETLGMLNKNLYHSLLSSVTLLAMMAFFVQFPLAGRLKRWPLFANIDWAMGTHKKWGQYIGLFFFLHPLLIVAPKLLVSTDDAIHSLIKMLTEPATLTGVIAWVMMLLWILMSIFKDRLNMRYETWRFVHLLGFVVILTLAVLHITKVGSHGQYQGAFNYLWWALYTLSLTLIAYNYLIKPLYIQRTPYQVSEINRVSERDWQLTLTAKNNKPFTYQAGQFVWINSSGNAFNLEQHPFSIVSTHSAKTQQTELSFVIRELGDYTKNLSALTIGQEVFVDGPYGTMTLDVTRANRYLLLIAGGVGIAPMLSLLRELAKQGDEREIHLMYADRQIDNMVYLKQLIAIEQSMPNFKLHLVCEQLPSTNSPYQHCLDKGFVDQSKISKVLNNKDSKQLGVYLCGPQVMIAKNCKQLKQLGVLAKHVHFEQLSF